MRTTMVLVALLISGATIATPNPVQLKNGNTTISSTTVSIFGSFNAHRQQNGVALAWNTVAPGAVSFIIQHSLDGVRFDYVGEVPAQASGWNKFKDDAALPGYNYYRIIAVMSDGSTEESSVEDVRIVRHK